MLHCIAAAEQGGETQLCDAFKAAEMLRENHPEYFNLLVKYPLEYEDKRTINAEFYFMSLRPVIR